MELRSQFLSDVRINKNQLEMDWLRQPSLYQKYSEVEAEAMLNRDLAKEDLDKTRADLESKIRKDPKNYDIERSTDSVIQSVITKQEEYQKMAEAYIRAKYELSVVTAMVRAIEHKKDALQNLVKLWCAGYYATPKVSHEEGGDVEEKVEGVVHDSIRKQLGESATVQRILKRRKGEYS